MIRTLTWRPGQEVAEAAGWDDPARAPVAPPGRGHGVHLWIDAHDPDPRELGLLSEALGVDLISLHGASDDEQRPHFLANDGYVRLALRVPTGGAIPAAERLLHDDRPSLIPLDDLTIFFCRDFVLTVHDAPVPLLAELAGWWRESPGPPKGDVETLVHRIVDDVIDAYFPVLDRLADGTEALQRAAWRGESGGGWARNGDAGRHMRSVMRVKRALLTLRRTTRAQREALAMLAHGDLPYLEDGESQVSFQDVFDHGVRVDDALVVYHEMLVRSREAYLTRVANELAISAQRLLVFTCLALIPTLVFTWYGQRFVAMPELGLPGGHLWAIGLAVAGDGAMLLYFRHRRWI